MASMKLHFAALLVVVATVADAQVFSKDKPASYNALQGYNNPYNTHSGYAAGAYGPYGSNCPCGQHGVGYGAYNNPYTPAAAYGGFPGANKYPASASNPNPYSTGFGGYGGQSQQAYG